jgi:AcrR family transcriptional regulator
MSEPEPPPAVRRRSATRDRLLEATREVLAREGIQGASVEHICEQAGFTRGAFYSNFSSKDDLLLALYRRERDQMFDSMRAATVPELYLGLSPVDAIGVIIDRFLSLQSVDRVGLLVHLEFSIRGLRGGAVGQEFNASWRELKDELVSVMTLVVAALGRELMIDPRHAATVLIGTYDEALRESVTEGREIDGDLLHSTLPMLLLAATRLLDVSAEA